MNLQRSLESPIFDLRSALRVLENAGHRVTVVGRPVDPKIEMIEDYFAAYRSADASWMAGEQPLRLYERPTNGAFPVVLGLFGSRARTRIFLDPCSKHRPEMMNAEILERAIRNPVAPVCVGDALDRVVEQNPSIATRLPVLTYTESDPGPTVVLGLVYARDSTTGAANCSVHRITLKASSVVIAINPTGHLQRLIDDHVRRGERLPISVNIGLDPGIYLAAAVSSPAISYGDDELGIAGGLRGNPVELAPCCSNDGWFIKHAEIVIEAELGSEKEPEGEVEHSGRSYSMPEYLGYFSPCGDVSTMKVTALTYRQNAIYQAVSGPGREQSELLGLGQEVSLFRVIKDNRVAERVRNIVALPSGGGHLFTVVQVAKESPKDDDLIRRAAEFAIENVSSTKNLVVVDEDVDPQSSDEVLWAMSTRFRAEMDIYKTRPMRGTPLDPTQSSLYCSSGHDGYTNKALFDCTVPFLLRARFRRAFS